MRIAAISVMLAMQPLERHTGWLTFRDQQASQKQAGSKQAFLNDVNPSAVWAGVVIHTLP
jgi:hypothetical protein